MRYMLRSLSRFSPSTRNSEPALPASCRCRPEAWVKPSRRRAEAAGAMHRGWINLKSAITSKDQSAILAECERGEDSAVQEFEKAMRENLPSALRDIVSRQYSEIKSAHDRIKHLRDAAKKAA